MSSAPGLKNKHILTPEAFGKFLHWLSTDHEQAAEMYLDLRGKLVKLFIRRGCAHAEELADETLDRVALIVSKEPERYSRPIALCCGVARKVWLEYLRKVTPDSLETEEIPASDYVSPCFSEEEAKCLACCLDKLPCCDRELITEYHKARGHEKIETRKRLADQHGGLNQLRTKTYRIRSRLRICITGCIRESSPLKAEGR